MQDKTIAVDPAKNVFEIGAWTCRGNLSFKSCEVSSVCRESGTGDSGDGSLRFGTSLGTADTGAGARGRSDLAAVGEAVRATRQDGPCGCEGII